MQAINTANQAGHFCSQLSSTAQNHTHQRAEPLRVRVPPSSDRVALASHKRVDHGGLSTGSYRRRTHVCAAGNTDAGSARTE
eukprot:2182377-Pyramimonas_sp.AAC.1